ncbi:MAG TPA: HEAT repeat domain-containing protein [Gemmatimonadaceae bacterium]
MTRRIASPARGAAAAVLLILLPGTAAAQALADRVARAPDGEVRFSFAAREGICGNGENSIRDVQRGSSYGYHRSGDESWEYDCEYGPVRIALTKDGERITRLRAYVGGRWRGTPATDLGTVSAPEAARWLVATARRADGKVGERAVFASTIADSVEAWPELLRLARDEGVPRGTRRSAVFWVGQAAGDAATAGLDSLVDDADADLEVREQAVFALSQRPRDEGVPVLIRLARTSPSPSIRKKALFWLGQSEDPRALALFEEILTRP